MHRFAAGLIGAAMAAGAGPVLAHTPYLLPNAFDAERDHVTLTGALTEDDYFTPDIALKVSAYIETLPDGRQTQVAPAAALKDETVAEADLPVAGTYRFSTGLLVGRRMKMAQVGGRWLMVRAAPQATSGEARAPESGRSAPAPGRDGATHTHGGGDGASSMSPDQIPPDAKIVETEGVLTAETFVSHGAPTQTALKTSGQGLELKPLTHPNAIYVDQGFEFQLLIDGKPVAAAPVTVYRAGDLYDERKITQSLATDAAGKAKASFERPGVYLLTAHYPIGPRRPDDAPPPRNYTYSLTFEVTR